MVTHTTSDKDQAKLMNNRQNGRRRGRGGQQVRNGQPGNQDRGNRIDNRARGNAAQLLEKYKNLAGEAQRQGDRVNTEYYLQFADHYFRVLSESRARFEEQRPADQRNQRDYRDDFGQDEDGEQAEGQRYDQSEANWGDDEGQQAQPQQREPRRDDRRQQDDRQDRRPRYEERSAEQGESEEQPRYEERRPRRQRTVRANGANGNGSNGETHLAEEMADTPFSERIEVDRLPQSLSAAPVANDAEPVEAEGEAEAPRRRRAPRRPRGEAVVEA